MFCNLIAPDNLTSYYLGMYRLIKIWLTIIINFLIYLVCLPFVLLLTPKSAKNHLLKLSKILMKKIFKTMQIELVVKGVENLPEKGFVLMANHQALLDILLLNAAIPKPIRFLAKKELRRVPILGFCMQSNGQFFIDRENPRNAIKQLKSVEAYVQSGGDLCVFPEGTRSLNGELLPFKKGSFKIPAKIKCPIVPCYIEGSGSLLKKGSLTPLKGCVSVYLGKAIDPNQIKDTSKQLDQLLLSLTTEAIKSLKREA